MSRSMDGEVAGDAKDLKRVFQAASLCRKIKEPKTGITNDLG